MSEPTARGKHVILIALRIAKSGEFTSWAWRLVRSDGAVLAKFKVRVDGRTIYRKWRTIKRIKSSEIWEFRERLLRGNYKILDQKIEP